MAREENAILHIKDIGDGVLKARWDTMNAGELSGNADNPYITVSGYVESVTTASGAPEGYPTSSPFYIRNDAVGTSDLYLWDGTTWVGPYNLGS